MIVGSLGVGRDENGKSCLVLGISQYRCPSCGSYELVPGDPVMIFDGSTTSILNCSQITCGTCGHEAQGKAFFVKYIPTDSIDHQHLLINELSNISGDTFRYRP